MKVLQAICQQIWKTQQWPQNWKRSVFLSIPKKGSPKECSNYCTIAYISHVSKVTLKILQARPQQYMNMNFQMFKLDLEKAEEPEIKLPTSIGSSKKQEFQKNIYFCFTDYTKVFDCVDHKKLWKTYHPRQHIREQRCYFANKILSSQSYGFSSSHLWM